MAKSPTRKPTKSKNVSMVGQSVRATSVRKPRQKRGGSPVAKEEVKNAPKYAWREIEDDLRRDLAIIGRIGLSNEDVLNLPLPDDNGMLWPIGTLLRDDDGTIYEWREE